MPILSSSTLTGDTVVNIDGENLGSIKDFMIDTESGEIVYAVLSFGGFLGLGDKLFAIPLEVFRVDRENHRLILDVPKERLENAPGFDHDNWPTTANFEFTDQVHTYYDLPRYSERRQTYVDRGIGV